MNENENKKDLVIFGNTITPEFANKTQLVFSILFAIEYSIKYLNKNTLSNLCYVIFWSIFIYISYTRIINKENRKINRILTILALILLIPMFIDIF
ncbi:MAG: hypothetical protein U0457_13990 [Candidatus Sericytochromatia bacterium]